MPRGNGNKPVLQAAQPRSWDDIRASVDAKSAGVAARAHANKVEFLSSHPSLSSLAGRLSNLRDELWSSINALANHADEVFGPRLEPSDVAKDAADQAGVLSALDREISMLEATLPRLAREVARFSGHA
jgi:hypothetical protein